MSYFTAINSILVGLYFVLLGQGVIRQFPKDAEAQEAWEEEKGGVLTLAGAISFTLGLVIMVIQLRKSSS